MSQPWTSSPSRESAARSCKRLQQATNCLRLYPSAHPTAHHALADFAGELTDHLAGYGLLMLRIEENRLLLDDEEVYYQEDLRSSLAFLMFRDGLRFLTFHPGVGKEELESFVDCLARADDLADIEHDLSTILWERDLQHIEYEVADPFLGGDGRRLRDEAAKDLRDTVLRRLSELRPSRGEQAGGGAGGPRQVDGPGGEADASGPERQQSPEGVDPGSVVVTEADIQRGEHAVEDLGDCLEDFTLVLLEIAGMPGPKEEKDLLPHALAMVVERCLDSVDVNGLGLIVDRLHSLEREGRRPPEFALAVFGEVTTSDRLAALLGSIDQSAPADARRTGDVLRKMRDWVLPSLLEVLAESGDKAVRKTALDVLDAGGGVPLEHLWPLMQDPRWFVVRNAVRLATRSGDSHVLERFDPLMRHSDPRVRREVIRSVDTLPGQRAVPMLVRALNDQDSSVRVLAAGALARHGGRINTHALEAQIESRDFATRPAEEINAFMLAFVALGGDSAVEVLNKIWRRKVFGSRPMPVRLGALQGLGTVPSQAALEALAEAAESSESQIQRAATRVLAEARARMGDTT